MTRNRTSGYQTADYRTTRHRTTRHRTAACRWLLPVAALVLLGAGCGHQASPGVASTGSGTAKPSASAANRRGSALAYSKCMRAHGVKDFPDPTSDGSVSLDAQPGSDLD